MEKKNDTVGGGVKRGRDSAFIAYRTEFLKIVWRKKIVQILKEKIKNKKLGVKESVWDCV